jgi:hypothetical protein
LSAFFLNGRSQRGGKQIVFEWLKHEKCFARSKTTTKTRTMQQNWAWIASMCIERKDLLNRGNICTLQSSASLLLKFFTKKFIFEKPWCQNLVTLKADVFALQKQVAFHVITYSYYKSIIFVGKNRRIYIFILYIGFEYRFCSNFCLFFTFPTYFLVKLIDSSTERLSKCPYLRTLQ